MSNAKQAYQKLKNAQTRFEPFRNNPKLLNAKVEAIIYITAMNEVAELYRACIVLDDAPAELIDIIHFYDLGQEIWKSAMQVEGTASKQIYAIRACMPQVEHSMADLAIYCQNNFSNLSWKSEE